MTEPSLTPARWIGPFNGEAVLHDGTVVQVISGETVVDVPAGEAAASANWEPIAKKDRPAKGQEA